MKIHYSYYIFQGIVEFLLIVIDTLWRFVLWFPLRSLPLSFGLLSVLIPAAPEMDDIFTFFHNLFQYFEYISRLNRVSQLRCITPRPAVHLLS